MCLALGCARAPSGEPPKEEKPFAQKDQSDHRAFTATDAWYRPTPLELITAANHIRLEKDDLALVTDAKQAEAQASLKDAPFRTLSLKEAEDLLGKPMEKPVGRHLVLLRAVILNEGTGAYDVSWRDGVAMVHHGCLGRHPAPMNKRTLVARLPGIPKEVYVDCSMAE